MMPSVLRERRANKKATPFPGHGNEVAFKTNEVNRGRLGHPALLSGPTDVVSERLALMLDAVRLPRSEQVVRTISVASFVPINHTLLFFHENARFAWVFGRLAERCEFQRVKSWKHPLHLRQSDWQQDMG
jgi:hypothetical protein